MPEKQRESGLPKAKKALGQNFIVNPGICPKMVAASEIDNRFCVLEIGPGLGALTGALAQAAKKVVAVEIDGDLVPALRENMADYSNVEIVQGDIMQLDIQQLLDDRFAGEDIAVFGNLPYYITTPILMKLLESRLRVRRVVAMVQKEAAQRLCAEPGSRAAGAVSLAVRYYSAPSILFDVSPGSFFPRPDVTSSAIRLDILQSPAVRPRDEAHMFRVIKAAFAQRRKTAANAISAGMKLEKDVVQQALASLGVDAAIRPERLDLQQFCALSDYFVGFETVE